MNSFSSLMSSMNPFSSSLSFNIGGSSSSKYTSEGIFSVGSNIAVEVNLDYNMKKNILIGQA
ncbi:hypothetical protein [Fusobacterium sp. PH5-44]